ncbi:MAG: HDOD domain-containing protein [Acidobacteriota bacterium]|jgi:EAL and modified HD-GYP domain-containing signal transduction protein|nr:HDOD domain-containing protein [Acidobacteriota bacterium]
MDTFVARQPIFDTRNDVYGYELLYRSDAVRNFYDASADPDQASKRTLINSFVDIGLDKLTGGRKAFVNFTKPLLVAGIYELLPPELLTVEILEDIAPTPDVLDACLNMKKNGFQVAMDDFVFTEATEAFFDYADIIKVDFLLTPLSDIAMLVRTLNDRQMSGKQMQPIRLLAEKIENKDIFNTALEMGFEYFQGYYFSKPVIVAGHSMNPMAINRMSLLRLLLKKDFHFDDVADVVKHDVALSYRLLQFVNSAHFGFRAVISNIQQALVVLGTAEVRKWMTLICLVDLNRDKTPELTRMSLIRARFFELVAPFIGKSSHTETLYLLGMFSLMDTIMEMPMTEVFTQIRVDESVSDPLISRSGGDYELLRLIELYEHGDFDAAAAQAEALSLPENRLAKAYMEAVQWTTQLGI